MKPKHLILSLLALFASITSYADDYVVGQTFTVTEGIKIGGVWSSMKCEIIRVSPNNACEVRLYPNSRLYWSDWAGVVGATKIEVEIPVNVFYNGAGFTVTSIGKSSSYPFFDSSFFKHITKIILPPTIESIINGAFVGAASDATTVFTEVSGADNLKIIGDDAFAYNLNLGSFPDVADFAHVEEIGDYAFYGCNSLHNTFYLANIRKIGMAAFKWCKNLTSVELGEQLEDSIPYACFMGCRELTSIKIPEGVYAIGGNAFRDCGKLKSIEIPSSVNWIGDRAFGQESYPRTYTVHATTPPTIDTEYDFFYNSDTIYVPLGCASAYQAADHWKKGIIIEKDLRENQSISLASIPTMTYGQTNYTLPATTNQGQSISWTSSNTAIATISGNVLSIKGAGTCTITATQAGSNQYLPFNQTYSLTINKATLTIKANNISIQQGEAIPPFSVTYSGFKYSDNESVLTSQPNITCNATSASAPGTYDINVSGASAKNYNINYVKGTLTITEAPPVTITANSYTRVYGDENPAFEFTSEGAPLNGVPEISCAATPTSPVGTYPITITKGTVQNYNDTYVSGTLTITKAPLVITANDVSMVQGSELPEFTASYSGFKNGENEGVLTAQPSFSCSATSQSPAGTYPITASGAAAANYNISYVEGTLTVIDETLLNNRLYAETVSLRTGTSKTFGLKLDNTLTFIACEFYLQLPEGVRIETDEDGYPIAELVSGRINRHSLEVNHVGNGLYHFLCYSSRNNAFVGNSGDLITLTVTCDENVLSDTYTATIKDIMFSDQDKQQVDLLDSSFDVVVTDIIPGDANGDEKINVMDVVEIVSYIMSNASDSFVFAAADIDENGTINVMDLVNVVSLIMTNTNQPTAAPRRRSAAPKQADAVTDELTVADFSIAAGETKEVSMVLDNPVNDFIAFEFWMSLPDGVRIAYDGGGELMATLNAERADGHDFLVEEPNGDGIYHFLCYSGRNKTFKGNSGELVNLTITCADDATTGDATGTIYDIIFSDPDKNEVDLANLTFNISVTDAGTGGYVLDESSSKAIKAGTYGRVILKRSFAEGWNTVCLPFAIGDIEEVFGTGTKAYKFDDFDDGELGFVPVTSFEPCTPYVIYVPTAITDDIILTDVYIDEEDTEAGYTRVNRNYYFRGSFSPVAPGEWTKKNSTDDIFGLTADGRIRKAGSGAYINGFHAYFDLPEGAAVKGFIFDDDATGIDNVNANLNEAIFNLAGQRLKKAQKGINIINGKKILK